MYCDILINGFCAHFKVTTVRQSAINLTSGCTLILFCYCNVVMTFAFFVKPVGPYTSPINNPLIYQNPLMN